MPAQKYCVIGAGASGLAVAKNFKQLGIPFECLEREADIGGVWNFDTPSGVVYETTHMLSSKEHTAFEDFPMPDDYPMYPCHKLSLAYLRQYAEQFGLLDSIEFGKSVERVEVGDDGWRVQIAGEAQERVYAGLVLANGHHDKPRRPNYEGAFAGDIMHSRDYRSPTQLQGKRVLVVGAGNSGADIATDASHHAAEAYLSMRRGNYFVSKYTLGLPTDDVIEYLERLRLPRWLKKRFYGLSNWVLFGPPSRYGLPKPTHNVIDTHPTVNSELPSQVAHGRVTVKPDIAAFSGTGVRFMDGTHAEVDLVVFATGYQMSFPFIDDQLIMGADGRPNLFLNAFHRDRNDFFVAGLVQANGSMWRLADYQAQLIASAIVATSGGSDDAHWFAKLKRSSKGASRLADFVDSERHILEQDYYAYRRTLMRLIRKFGDATMDSVSVSRDAPDPDAAVTMDAPSSQHRKRAA
ncbi:MAG: flavin-containing monooxygenase [Methyloligellaceae bacterium]